MSPQLQALYTQYAPVVYRRCRTILKNEEEAWDGVQEVFLHLAEKRVDLKAIESPTAYLWRMATNYSLNRLKREGRSGTPPEGEVEAPHSDHEEVLLRRLFLERLFAKVSPRTRELAWYRWVDRLTWDETALASGLSVSGVRKHLAQFMKSARHYKEHVS